MVEGIDEFARQAARNACYSSSDAVTDFLEAIGLWVEVLVNRPVDAQYFSLMVDKCTDNANIRVVSLLPMGRKQITC